MTAFGHTNPNCPVWPMPRRLRLSGRFPKSEKRKAEPKRQRRAHDGRWWWLGLSFLAPLFLIIPHGRSTPFQGHAAPLGLDRRLNGPDRRPLNLATAANRHPFHSHASHVSPAATHPLLAPRTLPQHRGQQTNPLQSTMAYPLEFGELSLALSFAIGAKAAPAPASKCSGSIWIWG